MFEIKLSMFQGDTLSPVIFLTAFNPLIEIGSCLTTSGFSLKVPVSNSVALPPVNSTTYVYWDENSDEPVGWYYAVVKMVATQTSNIRTKILKQSISIVSCGNPQKKGQNPYQKPDLPSNSKPPQFPPKKIREKTSKPIFFNSSSHLAKALLMTFQSSPLHLKITNPSC